MTNSELLDFRHALTCLDTFKKSLEARSEAE